MTQDPVAEELRRRASLLAVPPGPPKPADTVGLLAFTWAGGTYLVPTSHVRATVEAGRLSRVPSAPTALRGVGLFRSQVLPVVDLVPLLELAGPPRPVRRLVVLEQPPRPSLALAADDVDQIVSLSASSLREVAAGSALIRSVTPDGAALLDADALLDMPPFHFSVGGTPS